QLGGHVGKAASVVSVQSIRDAVLEAGKEIEMAVVVEIGPAVRLSAGDCKQVGLNQLELRRDCLGRGREQPTACRKCTGDAGGTEANESTPIHPHVSSHSTHSTHSTLRGLKACTTD